MSHDPDRWVEKLLKRELPSMPEIKELCTRVREELAKEPNVLQVEPPVTVVGDIHGQFYDLMEMFKVGGKPPATNYLFMGDYVDRGYFSVETLLLLFAFKVRHPRRIHLIRGNHETRQITQVYGFYDECMRKFADSQVWSLCTAAFDCLALAALVGKGTPNTRFAVHAGLTPSCDTIDQIQALDRKQEVPHEGPVCDLVWSDPEDITGGWGISPRGAGYVFGADVCQRFNQENNISCILRSHQLVMTGYREMFNGGLVTVWSAPNYCYRCGNSGAILELDENMKPFYAVYGPCPTEERQRPPEQGSGETYPDYFM
ncbi:Serine/threonine-protein phosphatase 4 catalytic subunit [Hondaea fermentalgiana]|uniref:Serine/threonine-protein phosphatase n=1 Tax=Hondaea fermentalgiana TaxID=2315210 RepID=A0A2R5GCK9_9STRA|nr:Serine/threonine-protein phosphatase 4 catalytic subunit [Hondaea fermentalgiana]|eukprot:GBG27448.1 Serine/threonine-protein phosphatase 4 catalytic subunit [Hondaea fermentalgiana]